MGSNLDFQGVIRDVHDPVNHALQITGGTGGGNSTVFIGNPTLFAVVNTAAVGVGNSIVTVANPNFGINAGVNSIGFATVQVASVVPGTGATNLGKAEDAAHTTGDTGVMALGVRNDDGTPLAGNNGDYIPITTDSTGALRIDMNGTVSPNNSSVATLTGNSVFTGTSDDCINYNEIRITVIASHASATDGLSIQQSSDNSNWDITDTYSVPATMGKTYSVPRQARYIRVVYTNGAVNQTSFRLQTILNRIGTKSSSQRASDAYSNENDLEEVWSFNSLYNGTTWDRVRGDTTNGMDVDVTRLPSGATIVNATGTANIGSVSILGGGVGLNAGINGIGFATVNLVNQPALVAGAAYIGLATIDIGTNNTVKLATNTFNIGSVSILGGSILANLNTGTLNIGSVSILGGKIINDTSTLNIGSVSVLGGVINTNLNTGTLNIGSVSVLGGTINSVLQASTLNVGSVSILGGKIVNDTSTLNIGSVSVLGGGIGLNAGVNGIGFATVKIDSGTQFIGLVTAWIRNAGTTKTLANNPFLLSSSSVVTIAVPTNAQVMYVTNLLINSDATVRVSIKSGVTYLTGNASIGVVLNPGGGWVESGSPDSPVYVGNPSGALVVEKFDMTGTKANIGGKVVWYTE